MKNYYEILGLSRAASEHEIKRVYRRLAITYHPDKNPSPEAEVFFKEVNEAYEILGDPIKKVYYDQLLNGSSTVTSTNEPTPAWHRDPAYRRRRQAGYKPPPKTKEPSQQVEFMQASLPFINIILCVSFLYCMLLTVDFVLPSQMSNQYVVGVESSGKGASKLILVISGGYHFEVTQDVLSHFPFNSDAKVYRSALFSILVKVKNEKGDYVLNSLTSIYRIFFFWPCSLILVSALGLFHERGTEFKFNTGVVAFILFFLNIIFFFISRV